MTKNKGKIEVVCGPMFAGKSEELIRRIKRLEYAKKKMLVFKPEIDNRYSQSMIVSHSSMTSSSINISKASEILDYLTPDIDAIIIDEVQFLDEELVDIVEDLANKGIRVILGGLDRDFRGKPFGIIAQLLAISEEVTKLTAICVVCGEEATRTQRIINGKEAYEDDPLILIGADESYEPRCRLCHKVLKK